MTVFVIAMDSEAEPLISKIKIKKDLTVHGRRVVRGKLYGKKAAVVVCGVGKVNAAAGTQYAIDVLGAKRIVNIGVAGGLHNDMNVGCIYGISHAVQYDFDLTELNGTKMGTLNEYDTPYLELAVCHIFPLKNLGSADRFNDDKYDYKLLSKILGADVRDMEGGAIAHVCKHAEVPFYSFKAISDLAGSGSTPSQFKANLDMCMENLDANLEKICEAVLI